MLTAAQECAEIAEHVIFLAEHTAEVIACAGGEWSDGDVIQPCRAAEEHSDGVVKNNDAFSGDAAALKLRPERRADELALGEYDGVSGDAVAAAGIAAIEDGIADEVEARFGITVGVSVIAACESDVYSVDSVLLSLPAEADEAAVCDYVRYISGCGRVEVTR